MTEEILKFTKLTILLKFLSGIVFSIMYWLPEFSLPLFGLDYSPQIGSFSMMVGSAVMGLTIGAFFALRAQEWKQIRILVIAEIVWQTSVTFAVIINLALFNLIIIGVLAILLVLVIMYVLSFMQQEELINPIFS